MKGLERFLRTLRGEQNVGDIASPGSWVQFFVAPALTERPPRDVRHSNTVVNHRPFEKIVLGVADGAEEYVPAWDPKFAENGESDTYTYRWTDPNGVEIYTHQFGALANGSLWLDFMKRKKTKPTAATEPTERGTNTETTENSTKHNSDVRRVSEQEEEEGGGRGGGDKDLWQDLETDMERKITVPDFKIRSHMAQLPGYDRFAGLTAKKAKARNARKEYYRRSLGEFLSRFPILEPGPRR